MVEVTIREQFFRNPSKFRKFEILLNDIENILLFSKSSQSFFNFLSISDLLKDSEDSVTEITCPSAAGVLFLNQPCTLM